MDQELSFTNANLATPRRSARKSVKPAQDYCEIIRGISRSATKNKENFTVEEEAEDTETVQTKWTPKQVGRVSQKRGRKSRRNAIKNIETELIENEVKIEKQLDESNKEVLQEIKEYKRSVEEKGDKGIAIEEQIKTEDVALDEVIKIEPMAKVNGDETNNHTEYVPEIKLEETLPEIKDEVDKLTVQEAKDLNCKDSAIEISSSDKTESFGTYLKANPIDISDLGLSELTNDAEKAEADEEMPSLIVCDDDDELEDKQDAKPNLNSTFDADEKENLNSTFDTSDCIVVRNEQQRRASTPNKPDDTQKYLMLDDGLNTSLQPPPCKKVRIDPKQLLDTPKQKSKPSRFPTPYKLKININDEEFAGNKAKVEHNDDQLSNTLPVSTSGIKDIVLRSIRKRSLSVCIDGKQDLKRKRVYFHSPANQTTNIEDVDLQMAKNTLSCKKNNDKRNVTMRRKRSMSVDDVRTIKTAPQINVTKPTPTKSGSKPIIRTKIPNFAAIHQRNNQKTENIAEYVARKAERAKVLLDSANKVKSAQKQQKSASTPTSARKPTKAAKRIVLTDGEQAKAVKKPVPVDGNSTTPNSGKEYSAQWLRMMRLNEYYKQGGTPALQTSKIAVKPVTTVAPAASTSSKTIPKKQPAKTTVAVTQTKSKKVLNPTQKLNVTTLPAFSTVKPTFNLSTIVTKTVEFSANNTTTQLEKKDKFAARRQRHIDMFKGRAERSGTEPPARRQADVIRGVRSNRRFELQMQHRRNLES